MHVYRADLRDLNACLQLESWYETTCAWQVAQQDEDGGVVTRFRTVELPRTMRVRYPSWGETLLAHQERGDLILVAGDSSEILGYLDQESQPDQGIAWLHHLIVGQKHRRQGIGSAMLDRGLQHARKDGLERIMTVVQSKNHPGICFLQRHGFRFCGYNEGYYRNQDIGLYFVCNA